MIDLIISNDISGVRAIFEKGIDINKYYDTMGYSLIHRAKSDNMIRLFLEFGYLLGFADFIEFIYMDRISIMRFIFKEGLLDPNKKVYHNNDNYIYLIVSAVSYEMVILFIEYGFEVKNLPVRQFIFYNTLGPIIACFIYNCSFDFVYDPSIQFCKLLKICTNMRSIFKERATIYDNKHNNLKYVIYTDIIRKLPIPKDIHRLIIEYL